MPKSVKVRLRTGVPHSLTFSIPAMAVHPRTKVDGKYKVDKTTTKLKLIGYYTQGSTPNFHRLGEYMAWKDHVREHAPKELSGLIASHELGNTDDGRVELNLDCYFVNGTHNDPENVRKSVVDALFPKDKWVYGFHSHPRYDRDNPRLEVTLTFWTH